MKKRLDILLTEQGLFPSREKARGVIMAGQVYVNGQKADKAGMQVNEEDKLEVRGEPARYVSRGGVKLEKAMSTFPISLTDAVCMDIGASTGGFTDCMLQNGAKKVFAVDVGYGQLAWNLRVDERVINMERTNIRYVTPEQIGQPIDFISVDVSFISLKLVLPVAVQLLREGGEAVCLVKPQFEAGRENVGKKGVVRDAAVHRQVLENALVYARANHLTPLGLTFSPVKGPEGNIEYLMYLRKGGREEADLEQQVAKLVEASHTELES